MQRLTRAKRGQVLSEMDFPSGPWTGFYNYGRSTCKHRMDLVLTFADQTVSGDGSDDILVGAGPGGGPQVRAISGKSGRELASFFADDSTLRNGVRVGAR